MEDRDDKLSSSLPETLHAHIIRPNDLDGPSDEASSSVQDKHPVQRQASKFISSLTPATFPNSHGSRGESSHRLVSPDIEESGYSTRNGGAAAGFAHLPGSEPPFHYQYHSYTYPPLLPNQYQYYVPSPNTFQGGGAGPSSLPHRARRPGGGSRAPGGSREGDDDKNFGPTYDLSLDDAQEIGRYSTSQPRPVPVAPFFSSRASSPRLYSAPHSYDDSRRLQQPSHHLEPNTIRHHSLPSRPWDTGSRSGSSSSRHAPGALPSDRPIQRASSYSLPSFGDLTRPLRQEYSDRGLQSPPFGVLDKTQKILPTEGSVEGRESSNDRPTDSASASRRGKRKRSDTQDERKTKAGSKIYVACDFCRGRKLRCDGSKPSCANCFTRKLNCEYKDHPRRRGPGKAPKGSRTKKSEGKGRKGRKSSKAAASEADREGSEQPSAAALPDRHVFEPPMMLPGHSHLRLSELEAVYAPPPYADRPIASNLHREGAEAIAHYQFTSGVFEQGGVEGLRPGWGRDEEDSRSAESGHTSLPPGDTDEEDRHPQLSTVLTG
ncbi:hypothetical protein DEU56DRAFT_817203 [Suillus clintonianus]|uniref:uncharacterized protein n=1 Tax=Suillus clintonianus TaxID=1904413 RepID=UPI001B85C88B|nr:uncharacterized protein DEU56DRAFT_817203 [Suillus clintonianus]KAG2129464.1 hypothetical protein DEU56DRAFT_817203 [Suillus clintonianus]